MPSGRVFPSVGHSTFPPKDFHEILPELREIPDNRRQLVYVAETFREHFTFISSKNLTDCAEGGWKRRVGWFSRSRKLDGGSEGSVRLDPVGPLEMPQ